MQPASKAEGDGEGRGAVGEDVTEAVVADLLDRVASAVGDEAKAADLIVAEIVGGASLCHRHRQAAVGVLEAHEQRIAAIVHGEEAGQTLPEIFFRDDAVDLLGDPSALRIVEVLDDLAIGLNHLEQFAA